MTRRRIGRSVLAIDADDLIELTSAWARCDYYCSLCGCSVFRRFLFLIRVTINGQQSQFTRLNEIDSIDLTQSVLMLFLLFLFLLSSRDSSSGGKQNQFSNKIASQCLNRGLPMSVLPFFSSFHIKYLYLYSYLTPLLLLHPSIVIARETAISCRLNRGVGRVSDPRMSAS